MATRIKSNYRGLIQNFNSSKDRLIVLSTYFTSKLDPIRGFQQAGDNFEYFRYWYESVDELGLRAVIFCDTISDDFKSKYETEKIIFIRCELGAHSLNDERFFIFYEFVKELKSDSFVVSTDINDVIINKNPLELFITNPDKLFIGRGIRKTWKDGIWPLNALFNFNKKYKYKLPISLFNYPVFSPGTIGGKKENIEIIFGQMVNLFSELGDDGNYDMQVFNFLMKKYYYITKSIWDGVIPFWFGNWFYYIRYRVSRKLEKKYNENKYDVVTPEESICENEKIYSGFPFVSIVGKYEKKGVSKAYLIHK